MLLPYKNKINLNILDELQKILNIKNVSIEMKNGSLNDQTFMLTGRLKGISRAEAKSLIEENSGTTVSNISKKLDYLIIGDKPTKRKIEQAKQLNIKIILERDWNKILNS